MVNGSGEACGVDDEVAPGYVEDVDIWRHVVAVRVETLRKVRRHGPGSGYHGAVLKCDGARPARSAGPRLGVAGRRAGELDHVGHSNNCSLWLARGGWLRKRAVGQCQVRRATAGDRAALIAAGRHVTLSPATLHTTNICDNNQCAFASPPRSDLLDE